MEQEGPLQVPQQQKKDQTKQGPPAEQVQKTSDEGHEKDQALSFYFGLYQQGKLMGLKWQEPGKGVRQVKTKLGIEHLKWTHTSP